VARRIEQRSLVGPNRGELVVKIRTDINMACRAGTGTATQRQDLVDTTIPQRLHECLAFCCPDFKQSAVTSINI
jgi:hypothetical protein